MGWYLKVQQEYFPTRSAQAGHDLSTGAESKAARTTWDMQCYGRFQHFNLRPSAKL